MKLIKKSRWLKTFLAAILIISMTSQSTVAYAVETGTDGMTPADAPSGDTYSGEGWIVSIQRVENTAANVAAGSTESEVSFDNAWLYDFPECYYATTGNSLYSNPEKYVFIGNSETKNDESYKYYVANPDGGGRSSESVKYYKSTKHSYSESTFKSNAQLLEGSSYYETILTGIKSYSLTSEYVIYAANSTGNLQAAINSFVGLWQKSENVDDVINSFVFESDDYWDQVIRYLDLLIIVNAMCGNAWSNAKESTDYIQYYLDNLNNDGSEYFVAIVAAAAVNYTTSTGGSMALMTLPVYYGRRSGLGVANYISWDGAGGDWDAVRAKFESDAPNQRTGYNMSGNASLIWWNSGLATSVYPVGSDGSLGFCGYTYIAPTLVPDPDDIIKPTDSSNPSSSSSSSVAATDVVTPTFTVEVTTENEYMQRDTSQPVTATVTIDMGQTDAVQKTFKSIYTSLKNSDESYKTAIEVFVERTFSDGSGVDTSNAVMDSDASGGYFASAVQPTLTSAVVYRWQGTDWDSGSNSSVTALPASPPPNPRTTTTPPSRQTERSSFCRATSPFRGGKKCSICSSCPQKAL